MMPTPRTERVRWSVGRTCSSKVLLSTVHGNLEKSTVIRSIRTADYSRPHVMPTLELGGSISVNGAALTVTS